jgi:hypothetical protein
MVLVVLRPDESFSCKGASLPLLVPLGHPAVEADGLHAVEESLTLEQERREKNKSHSTAQPAGGMQHPANMKGSAETGINHQPNRTGFSLSWFFNMQRW